MPPFLTQGMGYEGDRLEKGGDIDESRYHNSQVSQTCPGYLLASLTVYQRTLSVAPTVAAGVYASQALASVRSAVSHILISL